MQVTKAYLVNTSGGGLANCPFGANALQTVTFARHTPKDPQQALGVKGVGDYTNGVQTSDITLDCILVEAYASGTPTSIYSFADIEDASSPVLTSCSISFAAGNPATISYGYMIKGVAISGIVTQEDPDVSHGDVFAVVLGEGANSEGVTLADPDGTVNPSGVQSLNFNATVNRDNILDITSVQPVQFVTTYPLDLTVDLETYNNVDILAGASGDTIYVQQASSGNYYVQTQGLKKVDENESINVGGYLTMSYNYIASDILFPNPGITL